MYSEPDAAAHAREPTRARTHRGGAARHTVAGGGGGGVDHRALQRAAEHVTLCRRHRLAGGAEQLDGRAGCQRARRARTPRLARASRSHRVAGSQADGHHAAAPQSQPGQRARVVAAPRHHVAVRREAVRVPQVPADLADDSGRRHGRAEQAAHRVAVAVRVAALQRRRPPLTPPHVQQVHARPVAVVHAHRRARAHGRERRRDERHALRRRHGVRVTLELGCNLVAREALVRAAGGRVGGG